MAGEEVWLAVGAVYHAAFQCVSGDWLFSGQIQARHCASIAQEEWLR